jgi:transglutaminase-like putative cysteine protease
MVHIRAERYHDLRTIEQLVVSPYVPYRTYIDHFGNTCTRLIAPVGRITLSNTFVIADSGLPESVPEGAWQHMIDELPDDKMQFLLGSRYCDTQKLLTVAWSLFGKFPAGWPLVQAILNYTHDRITFGYQYARADRTAWEAHEERVGVCRDFAHLAITLCRCMNIPARYCTGYLGDIGVPRDPNPMDFSGWFEVYLGSRWYTMDARHNRPRIGRILMARGRDAADTPISVAFGAANLVRFDVITEEVVE